MLIDHSQGLRSHPENPNQRLPREQEKMDHHGPELWWLLLHELFVQIVSIQVVVAAGLSLKTP